MNKTDRAKEMCIKCGKYPAEEAQTWCEFCMGISKLESEDAICTEHGKDGCFHKLESEVSEWERMLPHAIKFKDHLVSEGYEISEYELGHINSFLYQNFISKKELGEKIRQYADRPMVNRETGKTDRLYELFEEGER